MQGARGPRKTVTSSPLGAEIATEMSSEVSSSLHSENITSKDLVAAITKRHARSVRQRTDNWAVFPEFRVGTGYARNTRTADVESRIDVLAFPLWPGSGDGVTAYEIKVSRSDFLSEIRKPLKRRPALRYSNLFFFVTPEGLLKQGEVPVECGLLEVSKQGVVNVIVPAPWRDSFHPTTTFVASVCRRVAQLAENEVN